ncbi:MAG: undecaprenyl/decaprenyl-phosphate alpha-N-acetylglucosaminyl 1-phosphate transferase, partial [Wenzhouxiangella sp.]|jgi:UDP-GlcNAc:undecaprenyl-phosphate GlcNAc-1-phosphate transferase|nr:undecaprenyl/decaprenyl-phosphate alpha-N-acetylglucosaminyl 1-phosphate transferase [Wenzhouxiangella sp.]
VFLINVINMTDGVDGLAGGISLLFFAVLALIAWLSGAPASLVGICLVMMAATGGVLLWNMRFPFRNSASAFMGDAGSMMLGFAAAWLAIAVATVPGSGREVYPILIVWVLLVPSMDTIAITVRRLSRGRSPMAPDRTHLHHIMRRCGLSVTATVSVIHLAVLGSGLFGVVAWWAGVPEWILFVLATGIIVTYTLALLNAHRILRWGLRRNRLPYNTPTLRPLNQEPDPPE